MAVFLCIFPTLEKRSLVFFIFPLFIFLILEKNIRSSIFFKGHSVGRSFAFILLGAFVTNTVTVLGQVGVSNDGFQTYVPPAAPINRPPVVAKRKDVKELYPTKKQKGNGLGAQAPKKPIDVKVPNKNTAMDKAIADVPVDDKPTVPVKLRSLTKKTIVIDARRLDEHTVTETIRYIKENPDVRLKLQNLTINSGDVVKILKTFKDEKILDQFREIGFVMLPGGNENLILNEKSFIEKVLPDLGYLEGIDLSCLGITDKVLEAISKKLPHLKSISLFGTGVTDKTIMYLAKNLPNLIKIHLINTSVTSQSIPLLVKEFPYLKSLGISGQQFKDKDYLALKEGIENIVSFSAVGQKFENMKTVKELLIKMPRLHTLDLSESNVNDDVAQAICQTPKGLQNLNISETKISFRGIKDIVNNKDLVKFKINNIEGIGDTELKEIIKKQLRLKVFHFSGAYFTNSTLVTLFHSLRKLTDVTLIPAKLSEWKMDETITEMIIIKKSKLQYLHIQPYRLKEDLSLKLKNALPKLRIEFAR